MRVAKLICFWVLLGCMFGFQAIAESDSNLADMSVDELLALRSEIDVVLCEKGVYTIIPEGMYVVGVDIAPGTYVISACMKPDAIMVGSYRIWDSVAIRDEYNSRYDEARHSWDNDDESDDLPIVNIAEYVKVIESFYGPGQQRIVLEDGQVFEVDVLSGAYFSMEKATMLFE